MKTTNENQITKIENIKWSLKRPCVFKFENQKRNTVAQRNWNERGTTRNKTTYNNLKLSRFHFLVSLRVPKEVHVFHVDFGWSPPSPPPGIWSLASWLWNLELGISNLESRIWNLEFRISNLKSRIWNLEFEISNFFDFCWFLKFFNQKIQFDGH